MRRHLLTLLQRRWLQLLAVALVIVGAMLLWPSPSFAACSDTWDPIIATQCSVDSFQYNLYKDVAGVIWWVDRLLLNAAYALDSIRWWLIEVAFGSVYNAVTTLISPLIAPFAAFIVILAIVIITAVPLTGVDNPFNVRLVLLWVVIGPTVLVLAGPLFIEVERTRSDIGLTFFAMGETVLGEGAGAPDLGAGDSVSGDPPPKMVQIYPGSLDTMTFNCSPHKMLPESRYSGGRREDQLTVLERTARFMWADARDIHCPADSYPAAFAYDEPDGPHYVDDAALDDETASVRQEATRRMNWGVTRLAIGLLPAIVCVLYYVIQLVFTLGMVLLWVAFPIGMIAGLFQANLGWATTLIQRAGRIIATSWTISMVLGIFVALLGVAGESAATFAAMMIGMGACLLMVMGSAVQTLKESLEALGGSAGLDVAGGIRAATKLTTGAAKVGLGAATGGAGMAITGAAALRQTGSGRYAMAAALGRSKTLANVGMLGAAMGMVDEETASGLYAGYRSQKSPAGLKHMAQDAKRPLGDGTTISDRARDRSTTRRVARAQRGSVLEHEVHTVAEAARGAARAGQGVAQAGRRMVTAGQAMRGGASPALTAAPANARAAWDGLRQNGRALLAAGAQVAQNPRQTAQAAGQAVAQGARAAGRAAGRAMVQGARGTRDAVADMDERAEARERGVMSLDERGRVHIGPRVEDADLPADALTEQLPAGRVSRLLNTGHQLQRNDDGSVTYWKKPEPATPAVAKAAPRSIPQERAAAKYAPARAKALANAERFQRQARQLQVMGDPAVPSEDLDNLIRRVERQRVRQLRAAEMTAPERPADGFTTEERDQRRAAYRAAEQSLMDEHHFTSRESLTPLMRERARIRANGALPHNLRFGEESRPKKPGPAQAGAAPGRQPRAGRTPPSGPTGGPRPAGGPRTSRKPKGNP